MGRFPFYQELGNICKDVEHQLSQIFFLIYADHFYLGLLSFTFATVTLLYLFHLVGLILLLVWDACGRLSHKPKCFPLFLFPTAPPSLWHWPWKKTALHHFADTSHTGQRSGSKHRIFQRHISLWLQEKPTCHVTLLQDRHQTSLRGTTERKHLSFPHGESWDRGLKLFKHIFLSWSCRTAQDSSAHQPRVDFIVFPYSWVISEHTDYTNLTRDPFCRTLLSSVRTNCLFLSN